MYTASQYYAKIIDLKCCVIIPTYNNAKTLQRVLSGVLEYTDNVIVVNDGATDNTPQILAEYPQVTVVNHESNKGKGIALQTGFKTALALGYDYAITIDSDGQHYPDDLPVFIDTLEMEGPALLIGSRNMAHESVPKKSSTGNRISNYWVWVETGVKLTDTQSGYRLYPLKYLPKKFYTNKFEFEIEIITRTSWNGVPVKNVPVKVLYDPEERVSHFRPFRDFTRISIVHTILTTIALIYIKPRDWVRSFKKKGFKRFILENVLESGDSNHKKAFSMALGVFIGIVPLWGLQTVTVLFLAYVLKLNKLIAFTFSHVSLPPMIPFIVLTSLQVGGMAVNNTNPITDFSIEGIKQNFVQYLIGSLILATASAIAVGVTGYALLSAFNKPKQHGNA